MTWEELAAQVKEDTRRDERGIGVHKYDVAEEHYKMPDRGYDTQERIQIFADELVKRMESNTTSAITYHIMKRIINELLTEVGVERQ